MKGCCVIGDPLGTIRENSGCPLTSSSVGRGGILTVVRHVNRKKTPAGIEVSPDGVRKISGAG